MATRKNLFFCKTVTFYTAVSGSYTTIKTIVFTVVRNFNKASYIYLVTVVLPTDFVRLGI